MKLADVNVAWCRFPSDEWELNSNESVFSYTGFVQQASPSGLASPTNYISSSAGDTASLQFNGQPIRVHVKHSA